MVRSVSPGCFSAVRLRLVAGRTLSHTDVETSPHVVVVNRSFAQRYLGDHPIGETLPVGPETRRDSEVVGIIEDMRQGDVNDAPQPEIFQSYHQAPFRSNFDPRSEERRVGKA